MAKLSAKARNNVPKSEFGLPGEKKYPMPDKSHAANAKARATQQVKAGNLSPGSKAKIDAKANRVLGKSGKRTVGSNVAKTAANLRNRLASHKKNKTQIGFD